MMHAGDWDDQISESLPNAGSLSATVFNQGGSISPLTDVDLIRFTAVAGQRIGAQVSGFGELQPLMRLFGPLNFGSNQQIQELGQAGNAQILQWPVSVSGTYYIGISELANERYNINTGGSDLTSPSGRTGTYNLLLADLNDSGDPDLRGTSFSVTTTTSEPGDQITVNATIRNSGNVSSGAFNVNFYLSSNSTINSSDTLLGTTSVSSIAASSSRSIATTLTIPASLSSAGTYYVGMVIDPNNAVQESNETNNANSGLLTDYDYVYVSVGDSSAPRLLNLSPNDDAQNVPTDARLRMTFNENIRKGSGNIVVRRSSDGSVVQSVPVGSSNVTIENTRLSVALPQILDEGVGYFVELSDSVVRDIAGNSFEGIAGTSEWNFETETSETLAEKAQRLDQEFQFETEYAAATNWGGLGEKWIRSADNTWYFFLPAGQLYRWGGGTQSQLLSRSIFLTTFDSTYHATPSKLINAAASGETLEEKALRLDREYNFEVEATAAYNWGSQQEKWIRAADNRWFFILPSGQLYRWGGGSQAQILTTSTLLTTFDSSFHASPDKLINPANSGETLEEKAVRIDQALGLTSIVSASFNWGGANEKWIRSTDLTWYFMLPSGAFYRWGGGSQSQILSNSQLLETFDATFYADPLKLVFASRQGETLVEKAYRVDQQLNLAVERSSSFNWGRQNEKWIQSSNQTWYFMLPGGQFYRWGGGSSNAIMTTSQLIDTFDSTYYAELSKLIDAPQP